MDALVHIWVIPTYYALILMMQPEQNLKERKGETRPSSATLLNTPLQRRQWIAGMLLWVILILGMFLGLSLGGMIVLYFEGGLPLIQDVLKATFGQGDSQHRGTYFLLAGLIIGLILGATLSKYFWAWLVVKIGLLTEAERDPYLINSLNKSE